MGQNNWEADKMLDVYIHDYFLKRKLHTSAKAFMSEAKVATDPVAIDAPGGFLFEWWSVFWDIFIARTNDKHSEAAAAYIETQAHQLKVKEQQQQLQIHHLQAMQQRGAQLQRRDGHPPIGNAINAINSEGMVGQSNSNVLTMRMYEEHMKHSRSMDPAETSSSLMDPNRMGLLKSATNHQNPFVQNNAGGMSTALQQMQARNQMANDMKSEMNLGTGPKSLPMDPAAIYGQTILQSKPGLGSPGFNPGVTGPLKGWPLTGIDQLKSGLGISVQKPGLQTHNQYVLASQQQVLTQAQAQGIMGNATSYGDMDPRRLCGLSRTSVSGKDSQSAKNDGSICSPGQSSSPKMKMAQMQQSSSQQQQEQQMQQQQGNRKRKHHSSGAANSNGTGNTLGASPGSPPSTHTSGDGMTAGSLKHVNSMPKSLIMYGTQGATGLASSSNLLDDIDHFGDVGSLDDNVESFLSHDGDDRDLYMGGAVKQSSAETKKDIENFTFGEVGCVRTKNSKVTCCHFSSDGKILASAGHDKKAVLWNMDTLQTDSTPEEHTHIITDIRFRPNSTQFLTSSYDSTIRLWDAANPSRSLQQYTGHHSSILSVDFHPKKTELCCFCDSENKICYWNLLSLSITRYLKGGTPAQVRFQPRTGQLLAAASGETVSVFDIETDRQTHSFQGHMKTVNYVCWDENGDYMASVSKDCLKIWALSSGDCIHEFPSKGNDFYSCVFHPKYSTLLVVGGISSLELWNMVVNKSMTVPAHENIIASLAHSPVTGMVASASHDNSVKLWK